MSNAGGIKVIAPNTSGAVVTITKNGYPQEGLQLLCHNCNMSKQFYGQGTCTHERVSLLAMLRGLNADVA